MDYSGLNDKEIIKLYRGGALDSIDYMIRKYTPLIYKCYNNRYAPGYSRDDFIQEGFIGLLSAINKYDVNATASFYTFAKTCIDNSMNKLIDKSMQKKNQILNSSEPLSDNEECNEFIQDDPARIVVSRIINEDTISKVEAILSKGELKVYKLLVDGYSTKEISDILGKDSKSIDNSIQRIKIKARKLS